MRLPTPLAHPRREAFAQGLARGLTARAAYAEAGYRPSGMCTELAARQDVKDRVTEIRQHLAWGGSRDLAPLIDELMRLAGVAAAMNSAAGMMAAKAMISEAARLKQLLPREDEPPALMPHDRILSDEEWEKLYGPAAPGSGLS